MWYSILFWHWIPKKLTSESFSDVANMSIFPLLESGENALWDVLFCCWSRPKWENKNYIYYGCHVPPYKFTSILQTKMWKWSIIKWVKLSCILHTKQRSQDIRTGIIEARIWVSNQPRNHQEHPSNHPAHPGNHTATQWQPFPTPQHSGGEFCRVMHRFHFLPKMWKI